MTEGRRRVGASVAAGARGRGHRLARRLWYDRPSFAFRVLFQLSAPLSLGYRALLAFDRRRRLARRRSAAIPVISVGGLVAGGSGKTPVACWVASVLARAGARPGLVVGAGADDEALLHRRWTPAVAVVVDRDRFRGVEELARRGVEIAVLDDGFQHRQLARDLDLALVSAGENRALLPRGPRREPGSALNRADRIVLVKSGDASPAWDASEAPETPVAQLRFEPGSWLDLVGAPAPAPEGQVLAVSGIARPDRFAAQLAAAGYPPAASITYADHHRYTRRDALDIRNRLNGRTLVTTEKDAVKLCRFGSVLGPARALGQQLVWETGETELARAVVAVGLERGRLEMGGRPDGRGRPGTPGRSPAGSP